MRTPVRGPSATRLSACLLALGLAWLLPACGGDSEPDYDHQIRIETQRFFPSPLNVKVGETVRWVNTLPRDQQRTDVRTITAGPLGDPDPDPLFPEQVLDGRASGEAFGEEFIWRFDDPMVFEYHSRLPEDGEFSGEIRVGSSEGLP